MSGVYPTFTYNGHTIHVQPDSIQLPHPGTGVAGQLRTVLYVDGETPVRLGGGWIHSAQTAAAANRDAMSSMARDATPVRAGDILPFTQHEYGVGVLLAAAPTFGIDIADTVAVYRLHRAVRVHTGRWYSDLWRITSDEDAPADLDGSGRRWVIATRTLFYGTLRIAQWTRCSLGRPNDQTGLWESVEDDSGGDGVPDDLLMLLATWGVDDLPLPVVPTPTAHG